MTNMPSNLFARFWNVLRPDSKEIRNIYLFSILSGVLSLGLPLGIQVIINFIELGQLSTSWFVLVFLVVLSIGLSGMLNIFQLRITENLQQRIFTRSAFDFADRLPKLKLTKQLQSFAYELTHRFFDTLTIQKGISKLLIEFTAAILQLVFCLVLLSFYHSFFIFLGIFLVFTLWVIVRLTAKQGMYTSLEESSYKYKIAHWLKEIARARFSFSMAKTNSFHINRTNEYLHSYLNARDQHFKVLVKQYAYLIVFKVVIALTFLIIGGILVINQQMNIGQFVASEIIILLILSSVEKLILSIEVVYDVLTAVEKIGQVTDLELENEHPNGFQLETKEGISVQIENSSFQEGSQAPILQDVSFEVLTGEKVCLLSDSSLSSNVLFMAMTGQHALTNGQILLNGFPIENLNKQFIRAQIGTLMQQDHLISATVIENVQFGKEDLSISDMENQITAFSLNEYVNQLPEQYFTVLKPDLYGIPRDVERKLLLARAMLNHPQILLIEEPTAGLTMKQKEQVLDGIFKQEMRTIIFASTDPLVMERCDRIIELQQGKVTFNGHYKSFILK
jgi:ABC-type bacteriocin/lantibiotic exporter with double-glycine peptidase domain